MPDKALEKTIRTLSKPNCYMCSTKGELLHQGLGDRFFGVPGKWNFRECPNHDCGLLWLDPMPMAEDIPKLYSKYYTHSEVRAYPKWIVWLYEGIRSGILAASFGYKNVPKALGWRLSGQLLARIPFLRERIGGTVMWLEASQRGRLLDIGCGDGKLLRRMRDLGWDVHGIEPDHRAAQRLKSRFDLDVYQGDLIQAKFPQDSFDVITMHHVLEHLADPIKILKECVRILRKGGQLVLVTPNAVSLGSKRYGSDWRDLDPPRHLHLFTTDSMARALANAGLTLESMRTSARCAIQIWRTSDLIRHNRLGENKVKNQGVSAANQILKSARAVRYAIYQIWESILLSMDPKNGEEILVIAKKP